MSIHANQTGDHCARALSARVAICNTSAGSKSVIEIMMGVLTSVHSQFAGRDAQIEASEASETRARIAQSG